MNVELSANALMALASARTGHFAMESGLHSARWLDLDALFASPARIEPFVAALAEMLGPFHADVICGPMLGGALLAQRVAQIVGAEFWYTERVTQVDGIALFGAQYRFPRAFTTRLTRPRAALVDDVMSAGSSLRATYAELNGRADIVAVGSLLQLGDVGATYFKEGTIPVVAVTQNTFAAWTPAECPQCAAGEPLERIP